MSTVYSHPHTRFIFLSFFLYHSYILPVAIATISVVLQWITDMTCAPYSQICQASSDLFSHIYSVVFFFMIILAATKFQQVKEVAKRFHSAYEVMSTPQSKKSD